MMKENPHIKPPILVLEIPKLVGKGILWGLGTPYASDDLEDRKMEYVARFAAFVVCLIVTAGFFTALYSFPFHMGVVIWAVAMFDLVRSGVYLHFGDYYEDNSDA